MTLCIVQQKPSFMFLSVLQFPRKVAKIYVTGVDFLLTLRPFRLRFEQNQVDTFDAWGDINNGISVTQRFFWSNIKNIFEISFPAK